MSLEWSSWVASIGPALIAATIWTLLVASGSTALGGSERRSYQHGLAAAVIAYVAMLGATSAVVGVMQTMPGWIVVLLLAPVIEESARLTMARGVRADPPSPLLFGFAYGLFEAGLKLADIVASIMAEPLHPLLTGLALVGPIVPLLLHVFLSVLVFALMQRGVALPLVWLVAVALHGLHNWSVQWFMPTVWTHLAGGLLLRVAIFVALIAVLLPLAKRSPAGGGQMTSAP